MDTETPLGNAMTAGQGRPEGTSPTTVEDTLQGVLLVAFAIVVICVTAVSASAGDRYALVVTGASGAPQYAKQYNGLIPVNANTQFELLINARLSFFRIDACRSTSKQGRLLLLQTRISQTAMEQKGKSGSPHLLNAEKCNAQNPA